MKIKGYKMFLESQTEESISDICEKYVIMNYTINEDGSIDVDGDVLLYDYGLTKLPLKFEKVTGDFRCYSNQLTSLEGSPKSVGGDFYCQQNKLTSLEGGPEWVGGIFDCYQNKLTSLVGGPGVVLGPYYAFNNQITSFEGFPDDYEGLVYFDNNPVQEVLEQFPENLRTKAIHLINDYDAIWNGEVVPERLEMVKEKLGLEYPW
jgi:hypothetical protein